MVIVKVTNYFAALQTGGGVQSQNLGYDCTPLLNYHVLLPTEPL